MVLGMPIRFDTRFVRGFVAYVECRETVTRILIQAVTGNADIAE